MTAEQLQAARAEKWRQKANPLLTIENAEAWIESTGVSLFLPRKSQLHSPAPSFVEAVLGESSATPPPAAIQNAFEIATRLFAGEKATPLNLLGSVSEQPDFLVSPEALPYVYALRGDRDWKRGPREKSSPLVVESWKRLKREGALTASELQELLGREVTETAVLRALSELWVALRVLPVYSAGEATAWELFESRHLKAMQMGSGMAQATALSALISLYLDSVIAATSEEIEIFLSPLGPRSRIREVVHGLATTRQLLTIPLGTQNLLHIAGGLPEFPEVAPEIQSEATPPLVSERPPFVQHGKGVSEQRRLDRKPFAPREREGRPQRDRPTFGERPAARGARKPSSGFSRSGADRPRKEWKPRPETGEFRPRREQGRGGFGQPFRSRSNEGMGEQRPYKKFPPRDRDQERPPRKEWKPRREDGEGREFRPRRTNDSPGRHEFKPRGEKRSFGRKEWKPRREGGQEKRGEFRPRRTEGGSGFDRPYRSRTDDRRTGEQRPYKKFPPRDRDQDRPPRKEWKPRREDGERREFRPRKTDESPERREFKSRSFKPRREGSGFGGRGESAGEKSFGGKRPFKKSEGFNRKKPPQRERYSEASEGERPKKSFSKPGFKGGRGSGPAKSGNKRPSFGAKRPGRPGGKPSFGKRPNNRKGKKSGE